MKVVPQSIITDIIAEIEALKRNNRTIHRIEITKAEYRELQGEVELSLKYPSNDGNYFMGYPLIIKD